MSRRRAAEKRTILPDHKYKDLVLAKFMNRIMLDGKKSTSEKECDNYVKMLEHVSPKASQNLQKAGNSKYGKY